MPWPNTVRLVENKKRAGTNLWMEYLAAREPPQWVSWWSSEILESPDCVASVQSVVRWRVPWCCCWCCCCCCCWTPLPTSEIIQIILVWTLRLNSPFAQSHIHSPPPRIFPGCHRPQILNSGLALPAAFYWNKKSRRLKIRFIPYSEKDLPMATVGEDPVP